jgi:hypothetical protein
MSGLPLSAILAADRLRRRAVLARGCRRRTRSDEALVGGGSIIAAAPRTARAVAVMALAGDYPGALIDVGSCGGLRAVLRIRDSAVAAGVCTTRP